MRRTVPRTLKRRAGSPPPTFTWRPHAFLGANVVRGDRELHLNVAGGGEKWLSLVFEGPRRGGATVVLGDHGHRLIGEFANPAAAQRAAEGFAKKWLRGGKIDECECEDIDE